MFIFTIFFIKINLYNYKYKEDITMIDYSPLWQTMKEKKISQYVLLQNGIDHKTLHRLKNNSISHLRNYV